MAALLPVRMPQVAQGIPRCLGHNYAALPAVSMRLSLHVALRCKRAQVEVMLRRCVFFNIATATPSAALFLARSGKTSLRAHSEA